MALRRTVEPAFEALTLDEAKLHCRVDDGMGSIEDAWFTGTIATAREAAEARMQRAICRCTYTLVLDEFADAVALPMPRVETIESVTYVDPAGDSIVLPGTEYSLDNASNFTNWLLPAYGSTWPVTRAQANAVEIIYTTGWGTAEEIPKSIKLWMKLAIGAWYDVRPGLGFSAAPLQPYELPATFFSALLDPWSVVLV